MADLNAIKAGQKPKPQKAKLGVLLPNTTITWEKADMSPLNLTGKSKG